MLGHRAGVSQGERGVREPVLRDHRGMCKPGPAPVGILEEPPVDELEHRALPAGVRHRAVQSGRREQRSVGPRVQIDNRIEPARHPIVVKVHERDAHPRLAVVRLEVEHEQLREHCLVAERADTQCRDGRGRGQNPRLGPGVRTPRMPTDLERERRRQHQPHRRRHRGDVPFTRLHLSPAHGRGRAHSALR